MLEMDPLIEKRANDALDARARRAATKAGYRAEKSRWRANSIDNHGGFMLTDERNCVVGGERFNMSAEDVIEFCRPDA
jgi:hypothetical protein